MNSLIKGCIPVERRRGRSSNERQVCMLQKENGTGVARVMNTTLGSAVTSSGRKIVARLNPKYLQSGLACRYSLPQHGLKETRRKSPPDCRHNVRKVVEMYMCEAAVSFSPLA